MALNLITPITTKEGFEYLLNFTEFAKDHLPVEIDIPIVDVILKHSKKENLTNQEYRSLLFETMFLRSSNIAIHINEKIIIEDELGNHYIHLISKTENEKYFRIISSTVLSLKP